MPTSCIKTDKAATRAEALSSAFIPFTSAEPYPKAMITAPSWGYRNADLGSFGLGRQIGRRGSLPDLARIIWSIPFGSSLFCIVRQIASIWAPLPSAFLSIVNFSWAVSWQDHQMPGLNARYVRRISPHSFVSARSLMRNCSSFMRRGKAKPLGFLNDQVKRIELHVNTAFPITGVEGTAISRGSRGTPPCAM